MNKPAGYDQTQAFTGEFEQLELGGHVCVIKGARIDDDSTGAEIMLLQLDIAPTDPQSGFFMKQYEQRKTSNPDAKWGCVYRQRTGGKSLGFFKGLITAVEQSNSGYKWNWDENSLKGKLIGGIFGQEEFRANDGQIKLATKCIQLRSVEAIRKGVEVPKTKLLNPAGATATMQAMGFTQVDDTDELPF